MNARKLLAVLTLALAGAFVAQSAMAGGRARVSVGIGVGIPVGGWGYGHYGYGYGWGPYYPYSYYYPSYYYAPPVVVQQQPVYYVEQSNPAPQAAPSAPAPGYWYYCHDAGAYYPYVKECPAGWQRVAPQPQQ
jgi:hypothetical protein